LDKGVFLFIIALRLDPLFNDLRQSLLQRGKGLLGCGLVIWRRSRLRRLAQDRHRDKGQANVRTKRNPRSHESSPPYLSTRNRHVMSNAPGDYAQSNENGSSVVEWVRRRRHKKAGPADHEDAANLAV
jgi:hypothetical protein